LHFSSESHDDTEENCNNKIIITLIYRDVNTTYITEDFLMVLE